jgi:hypothetical protein
MPKIQQYTAQVAPQGGSANLSTPDAFGVRTPGDAIGNLTDFLEKKAERDDFFSVQKDMTKVRGDWLTRLNELEQNAPAGAPDFTKQVMDEYRAAMQKMVSERSLSRENMDRLRLEQEQTGNMLLQRALTFEASSRAQKRKTDAQSYAGDVSRNVFLAPFTFSIENDKLPGALEALGLSGSTLDEVLRVTRADMAQNAVKGMIKNGGDLAAARRAIAEGPMAQYINGDLAASLTNAIDVEQRHREAEARQRRAEARSQAQAEISVLRQDVDAEIAATGRSANLDRLKQAYNVAFADKPEIAQRMNGQLDNAVRFYTESTAIAGNTPEQDAEYRAQVAARVTGTNAAQQQVHLEAVDRAIAAKRKELAEDGFSYVVKTNPQIRQMLADAGGDPEKSRRVFAAIDQKQADLGVPQYRRTYLGTQQAAAIASEINANATTTPEQAANRLESMARVYGPLWGNVLNELAGKGLNPNFVTVARLDAPADAVVRTNLVSALASAAEARRLVGDDVEKDLKARVATEYRDFRATLVYHGAGGAALAAREQAAAEALALRYVTQGLSLNNAAARAAKELITDRYDFEGSFRAPKGQGSRAAAAASQVQVDLTKEQMAVPRGGDPGLTEDARLRAALSAARNGIWVNTPDGKGIELLQQDLRPVVLRNGQRVRLMFDALPEIRREYDR